MLHMIYLQIPIMLDNGKKLTKISPLDYWIGSLISNPRKTIRRYFNTTKTNNPNNIINIRRAASYPTSRLGNLYDHQGRGRMKTKKIKK